MDGRICLVALVTVVCLSAPEAFGACPLSGGKSGGSVSRGGKGGSCGSSKRRSGGRTIVIKKKKNRGKEGCSRESSSDFKKWPLPEEVVVRKLTADCDRVLRTLNLEEKQQTAIYSAKNAILKRVGTLQEAQTEARSAYRSCPNCAATAAQFARQVKSTAAACKSYNPNREYQDAILRQLTTQQKEDFLKALAK